MSTEVWSLIIGCWVIGAIISVVYFFVAKKKHNKKFSDANNRVKTIYNDPNIAKVALWIDLESVNGEPFDESMVYHANIKSNMTGSSQMMEIALLQPGKYTFVVNSREYDHVSMNVVIESGKVYQLGANESGPYFIEDPDAARYAMKEF